MKNKEKKFELGSITLIGAVITSLILAPYITFDVVNPPKFMSIAIFGGIAGCVVLKHRKKLSHDFYKPLLILMSSFSIIAIGTFILGPGNKVTSLYGVHGRQTGLLTYLFLVLQLLFTAYFSNIKILSGYIKGLLFTGLISNFYALLQIANLDPLPWDLPEKWVTATFANPNFLSSFIGISAVVAYALVFANDKSKVFRFTMALYILISLAVIQKSLTVQGYIVLATGIAFVSLVKLYFSNKYRKFFPPSIFLVAISLVYSLMDIFQKLPWSSVLYKLSVSARGDYWRGSLGIIKDHPWLGIGFDQFRNWYPRYRDLKSLSHGEGDLFFDSSHSIFLDMALNGGILLLLIYFLLLVLTLRSGYRILKSKNSFNYENTAILGAWIAYQVQTLISINHLGLVIWGWLLSGLIIGYEIRIRVIATEVQLDVKAANNSNKLGRRSSKNKDSSIFVPASVGAAIGMAVALPLFLGSVEYNSSLKNADPTGLIQASQQWPQDGLRMTMAAESVSLMGFPRDGYELARKAAEFDPEFSVPWKLLSTFTRIPEQEMNEIWDNLDELDPYFRVIQDSKNQKK